MDLNKSTRRTPTSRSGYFTEIAATAGNQTNYLLPFRIKITPNKSIGPLSDGKKNAAKMLQPVLIKDLLQSTRKPRNNTSIASVSTQMKITPNKSIGPLSDGKKNAAKMLQPVLIKDLLQSTRKPRNNTSIASVSTQMKITPNKSIGPLSDGKKNAAKMLQPVLIKDLLQSTRKTRNDTSIASVSTQKKKPRPQKSTQPYLNTQSCHKPKDNEVEQSTLFSRKSCEGNKVRRQLYQTFDSPQKSTTEERTIVAKKKIRNVETTAAVGKKSNQSQNKTRKSLLLPPNSIKNTYLKKSVSNAKPNSKLNTIVRGTTTAANKSDISRVSDARKSKVCVKEDVSVNTEEEVDIELHLSSPEVDKIHSKQLSYSKKDNFTMTSPTIDCSKLQNDNFISTINSISRYSSVTGPLCSEMQNLKINKRSHDVIDNTNGYTQTYQNNEHDFTKISNLDYNDFIQLKSFLEESIKSCEEQASKFKQFLTFINNVYENSTSKTKDASLEENLRTENTLLSTISENSFITTEIYKSKENKVFANNEMEVKPESKSPTEVSQKLPIPLRILVNDADLNQDLKETSSETLIDNARLSTIGEVSCEADVSNKEDKENSEVKGRVSDLSKINESCSIECENFENKENCDLNTSSTIITRICTPKTPRSRRSLIPESCDSQGRRRSARLAAKRASLSMTLDSDKQDSFTMLEKELNVVHPKVPSKSLPASPIIHPPMTPGIVKQWDKNMERPLREYMALKMNGTFLVTPDVKKFQSRLETTDTPHSRKSLSRKIFMELCDLYAESPEPK